MQREVGGELANRCAESKLMKAARALLHDPPTHEAHLLRDKTMLYLALAVNGGCAH